MEISLVFVLMTLSEIWIYPVKSLGGVRLKEANIEQRGMQYDRRWMVIDHNGTFLTQRTDPKMALLSIIIQDDGFLIFDKSDRESSAFMPLNPQSNRTINVKIWKDNVQAVTVCNDLDVWLSKHLEKNVRMVYMPDSSQRMMHAEDSYGPALVSFADDFPFLLISQASLDDLNKKLAAPVTMERFRPNFVVANTMPYAEDQWKDIEIGSAEFLVSKPCERCILINVDQESAVKSTEPLKTLASYRKVDKKILFGQNLTGPGRGIVFEGDDVKIKSNII
ncbi:MOSC domain-containing protein [Dyadobacter sp. CY345]|uniref:MOSC domain-containing protein n=1 Tax=Dyadobacter sp. CY345 TaxID=2909335 RepID=UPI001F3C7378|nr:MOSC N-terminal beta barrel domain-containing protein [Dyadobacter sp. CY345]MCF2447123.1 MOSC domain-containing protein [Dyadobacter sp. CY345]